MASLWWFRDFYKKYKKLIISKIIENIISDTSKLRRPLARIMLLSCRRNTAMAYANHIRYSKKA